MRQPFHNRIRALALACALLGVHAAAPAEAQIAASADDPPLFRIQREAVPGGGELLTVFGRLDGSPQRAAAPENGAPEDTVPEP